MEIKMVNGYVITFCPGSSGRFIANIVFQMKNSVEKTLNLTEENSAHNDNNYCDHSKIKFPNGDQSVDVNLDDSGIFKYINFLPSETVNIFHTHKFPRFSDWSINPNKDSFKIIIITIDKESSAEVCGNALIKNTISLLKKSKEELTLSEKIWISATKRRWIVENRYFLTPGVYDDPEIFKKSVKRFQTRKDVNEFTNAEISEEFGDAILVLKYKELFTKDKQGNFITLLKLSQWLDVPITENIISEYEKYAQGRINLIQTKMPWLNSSS